MLIFSAQYLVANKSMRFTPTITYYCRSARRCCWEMCEHVQENFIWCYSFHPISFKNDLLHFNPH